MCRSRKYIGTAPLYVLFRTMVGELYHGTDRLSTRISKFVCLVGIENSSGLWYTVHCKRCKIDKVGVSMQPKELEQWISRQYGVSAECPWAVSPENAVFRHRENKKWFALLLRVTGDKLGCPGTAPVWILNVKCDPLMIGSLCSMEGIYPAYHMNKTHWISIAMDDRVPRVLVQDLLDQSYASTASAPRRQKRR